MATKTKKTAPAKAEPKHPPCEKCGYGMVSFMGKMICSHGCDTPAKVKPTRAKKVKQPVPRLTAPKLIDQIAPQPEAPKLADDITPEMKAFLAQEEEEELVLPTWAEEPKLTHKVKLTREQWLLAMTNELRPLFKQHGATIPSNVRMSCGWPSSRALSSNKRVLGQCWPATASEDSTTEIFISPFLSDPVAPMGVGATLAHELVHACLPIGSGHGPKFRKLAEGIGLEGRMTATTAGKALCVAFAEIVEKIGTYPHAKLDMSSQKKQGTRLLKVICTNVNCEYLEEEEKPYVVRMSASVYDAGQPCCGVCGAKMDVQEKETPKTKKKVEVRT